MITEIYDAHSIPASYHFWRKHSDTEKKLFTWARDISQVSYLFKFSWINVCFEDLFPSRDLYYFTLFQETHRFSVYGIMWLYSVAKWRLEYGEIVRFSFDTGNNRLLIRKKHICIYFRIRVCYRLFDAHSFFFFDWLSWCLTVLWHF